MNGGGADWIGIDMGLEEKLPSGFLLTTVEGVAGYARKNSMWTVTFGLACCAIEMMATGALEPKLAEQWRCPVCTFANSTMFVVGVCLSGLSARARRSFFPLSSYAFSSSARFPSLLLRDSWN